MELAYGLSQSHCVGFIGPYTSGSTMDVSKLLSIPSIDRALMGYSATSSQLSDSSFSNFLRTIPSDDVLAKLMANLMAGLGLLPWAFREGGIVKHNRRRRQQSCILVSLPAKRLFVNVLKSACCWYRVDAFRNQISLNGHVPMYWSAWAIHILPLALKPLRWLQGRRTSMCVRRLSMYQTPGTCAQPSTK